MDSNASVGIGLGVTLGVLAVIAVILLCVGLCTTRRRQTDLTREMEHRREAVRQQYQREQEEWRERRLRQVVLVLIDRGEAEEGVPLAFQVPNHSEVLARRKLRNMRANQRARMEELTGDDPRLDEEARAITRMTLPELLANGRPQDAEPGPDVMQMLLDGQEVRPGASTDDDGDESEFVEVSPSLTPQGQDAASPGGGSSGGGGGQHQHHGSNGNGNNQNSGGDGVSSNTSFTPPGDAEEAARRRREDAIIRELRAKRDNTRRRKTAEELYGAGVPYLENPNNRAMAELECSPRMPNPGTTTHSEPTSAFGRFLSPLTPWRGKGGKRRTQPTQQQQRSAFENVEPNNTDMGASCNRSSLPRDKSSVVMNTPLVTGSPRQRTSGGSSEPF